LAKKFLGQADWLNAYQKCCQSKKFIQAAFDSAYEGIVITDPKGIIMMINQTYAKFLGVEIKNVIGKHCTEVIENSRMHIVAKTKEAELAQVQRIKGGEMIVHRIPILEEGEVIAVIGKVLFQNVQELHALSARVQQLQKELHYYKTELLKNLGAKYNFEDIIGKSAKMQAVKEIAERVALSDTTVFIHGESGTGKELFAHAIHNHSYRKYGPFVRVNCSAIPETLLESVLFGYEEGAFTGAVKGGKKGKFEMAHKGTIFLDEIGELLLPMQAKLLRVLQEKEIEPVGGSHPLYVDVRILAASNRNLEQLVDRGEFRADLFYRLNVISLHIPPLRERREDIPLLVEHLLRELTQETGIYVHGITPEAVDLFMQYNWPGNIRELRNILERVLHMKDDETIRVNHLPVHITKQKKPPYFHFSLREAVEHAEREMIQDVLKLTNGDRMRAMKMLGISKSSFYQKIKKYDIQ
jgi:PAS domain S-box-containing protein